MIQDIPVQLDNRIDIGPEEVENRNDQSIPSILLFGFFSVTSVCTIAGRCDRSIRTVWNTSSTPSYCIRSNTMLNEINTPEIQNGNVNKLKIL